MSEPIGHRGTRAVQRMVEYAPATGGLALWVRHADVDATWRAGETEAPVATDGRTLHYRPAFATLALAEQTGLVAHQVLHIALRHPQRYLHLAARLGDADLELYNICADAIVNSTLAHLSWLALPEGSVTLEALLVRALALEQPVEKSLLEWDVERLYRAIDDRRAAGGTPRTGAGGRSRSAVRGSAREDTNGESRDAANGGSRSTASGASPDAANGTSRDRASGASRHTPSTTSGHSGRRAGADAGATAARRDAAGSPRGGRREDGPRAAQVRELGARIHRDLLPGPATLGPPEADAEEAREWSERIVRAHAGDGLHSMLRALLADLPRTLTPWEQVLRTQLARCLAARPGVSWSRPSRSYIANQGRGGAGRRMPWEPGRSASQSVPRLAVIVDVSGSIDEALMARFAREVEAITRRMESRLVVVIGDHTVRHVEQFAPGESDLAAIAFRGGGGTDFTPLLEEADRHAPDVGVVLTDLEGPARFQPRWPVVWAVPEAYAQAVAPFGRKIVLR